MPDKTIPITGGCFCGALRYHSSEPPSEVPYCHCRMCQQSSGNPYMLIAIISKKAFQFTQGEPKYFSLPSSPWAERGFCAECGTTVIFRDFTESHGIYIGTLDHPEEWPPTGWHSGVESRIPWDTIHDKLPCWETESDPEFNETREEFEKLSAQLKEGLLTEEAFAQQIKSLFENGPST